ncbi:MAG TPA: phospholipase D-like domain-containing protein [Candidatus Gastranaerophilales bacterium]|nr:phospholipase D-like domain-containing protein [Candidatus Gastranaerophilales bacterium]
MLFIILILLLFFWGNIIAALIQQQQDSLEIKTGNLPKNTDVLQNKIPEKKTGSITDEFVVYNFNSKKYHNPNCKFAKKCVKNCKTIKKQDLPKDAQYCGYCKINFPLKQDKQTVNKLVSSKKKVTTEIKTQLKPENKITESLMPDTSSEFIDVYFIDPLKYAKPADYCRTAACRALLKEINNATESIEFAVSGIQGQPEIFNALVNAKKRGVKVLGVTDMTKQGINFYSDTIHLKEALGEIISDNSAYNVGNMPDHKYSYENALMHNKFFIFDRKKTWTGSTNISSTCLGGYNSNVSVLIKSAPIAEIYSQEFEQMYNKAFHSNKQAIENNEYIKLPDNTIISVYFSPKHKYSIDRIINLINNAKTYVYAPIFFLTRDDIAKALINAKNRGCDVRVILDATCARLDYSKHKYLRSEKVQVKTENFGGKMHMKSGIIDDKFLILGSMNWTGSGVSKNDENTLIIENNILAKAYKMHFLYLWNNIPEKFLNFDPKPESPDSTGSCNDGINNDYDDSMDVDDYDCKIQSNK